MVGTLRHYWVHSRITEKGTQPHFRSTRLLFAFSIAYLGSVDYLAKFGVPVYPFGNIFVFCFLVLAAQVIWTYRLVDITPAFAAEQILQTMSEPLIVCDLDGRIRIVNPAYTARFGQGVELYGQPISALASEGDEWHRRMLRSGGLKDYECGWQTRSGERVYVSLSSSVLHTNDNKPQGYVVLARDISERKHIEQELILFNETLEDRVKERTEELANKIKELEWLNTVMMGREERILELKERLRSIESAPHPEKAVP
jgi:PAS domain S-box-containing protein